MVRISVLYPNRPDSTFDMDYYLHTHMPLSIERLGSAPGFRGVSVSSGISAGPPDSQPPYVAQCEYLFDSLEAFMSAFTPHAELLQGDIANYTDLEPVILVSRVLIHQQAPG